MPPRRSPRLAAAAAAKTFQNSNCNLSNSVTDGCCYKQDLRPKLTNETGFLAVYVMSNEYLDGHGGYTAKIPCYTRYCPSCKNFWTALVKKHRSHCIWWDGWKNWTICAQIFHSCFTSATPFQISVSISFSFHWSHISKHGCLRVLHLHWDFQQVNSQGREVPFLSNDCLPILCTNSAS